MKRIYNEKGIVHSPDFDRSLISNTLQAQFIKMVKDGYDVQDVYNFLLEAVTACLSRELDSVRKSFRAHESNVQPLYDLFEEQDYELKRASGE